LANLANLANFSGTKQSAKFAGVLSRGVSSSIQNQRPLGVRSLEAVMLSTLRCIERLLAAWSAFSPSMPSLRAATRHLRRLAVAPIGRRSAPASGQQTATSPTPLVPSRLGDSSRSRPGGSAGTLPVPLVATTDSWVASGMGECARPRSEGAELSVAPVGSWRRQSGDTDSWRRAPRTERLRLAAQGRITPGDRQLRVEARPNTRPGDARSCR
jgi:hypothetical protein